jgi:hypothetical protein
VSLRGASFASSDQDLSQRQENGRQIIGSSSFEIGESREAIIGW